MQVEELTQELEKYGLEVVIGLESHVRLNTKSKLFCTCPNQEASKPNQNICSVCTGQMGVLPSINKEAIKKAIIFGKGVNAQFNEQITWDRKHYEYPDSPKNFQLTQFQKPIIKNGKVHCFRDDGTSFEVELEQAHIEEDAAKLMHEKKQSLVDFNKAGVPLIEVVTKPCIRALKDASTYAQYLQRIVQNLNVSEANLEKGEFKSDVSISLRKKGTNALNPRAEIKNLNSFKFMVDALIEEVTKQLAYYLAHKKFRPEQITVLWDENLKQTKTMRSKEYAADYRYVLEPDIPMVSIKNALENITIDESLLPFRIESVLIQGKVRPQDAKFFTSDPNRSKVLLRVLDEIEDVLFVTKILLNNLKIEDYEKVTNLYALTEICKFFRADKITPILLQKGIEQLLQNPEFDYGKYFAENSISEEKIAQAISEIIAENQEVAQEIKAGNQGKAGILVGKVMQKVGKGASGKIIRQQILDNLAGKISQSSENEPFTKSNLQNLTSKKGNEEEILPLAQEIIIKENYRTHLVSQLSESSMNQEVTLCGWVSSVRDHGDLVFIDFRDSSYEVLQIRLSREAFGNLDDLAKLKPESVIYAVGKLILRQEDDYNPSLRTGSIELDTSQLEVLNLAKNLPFEIKRATQTSEAIRFKYKFLDHRNAENRKVIINRHRVIKMIRDVLDNENFIEIETPILTAGTDEGAREFIVPSRKYHGSFYTLPQAPQQFKQLLMVGGFEKYFQIARCFRDEDSRGDRQPEFTQLDIEMAFVSMADVMDLNTRLFNEIVRKLYGKKWQLKDFQYITYYEAIEKYGTDRPDLRFGLEMQDITQIVKESSFQVFTKPIDEGGIVKCIKVDGKYQQKRLSKGQIERLTTLAQAHGLGGLAYIIVNDHELQSPIIKYLGEDIARRIVEKSEAISGDIVFFSAADFDTANKALDAVRQELGKMLHLINPKELAPAWVIDFPLFEKTEEGGWTFSHNPFSMPKIKDLPDHLAGKNIGKILSQQYDMVLNGYEIGGGSVRAHKSEILAATYKNMGYDHEEMLKSVGHMYESFKYGAPPHGGIAWGIDRLMMILERKVSIREVMAFPKTNTGEDLMFGSPSPLSEKKINEANIQVIKKK